MPRIASINPASLATPIGFAHGVASSGGRLLWLAGQNGMDDQGRIVAEGASQDLLNDERLRAAYLGGGLPAAV